ncbi:hypothetical protein EGW08_007702 [Elysia chlorotica]|uniref:Uncharacterized protein n=1 Tax=Elysia chlorotica TaxID=188477 RepID=A0A3S1BBP6_ELYCH|nr:hypothetical protein EGW08_007702 [Elysia chlorotica]
MAGESEDKLERIFFPKSFTAKWQVSSEDKLERIFFPKSFTAKWQVSAEDKLERIFFPKSAQPTWQVSAEDKLARIFFPKSAQPTWQVSAEDKLARIFFPKSFTANMAADSGLPPPSLSGERELVGLREQISVQKEKLVKHSPPRWNSCRSLKFSSGKVGISAAQKGCRLKQCWVKLWRVDCDGRMGAGSDLERSRLGPLGARSPGDYQLTGLSASPPANLTESTEIISRNRRQRRACGSEQAAETAEKKRSLSPSDAGQAESVPSSDLEESDAEDAGFMNGQRSSKRRKMTRTIPVPNLQQFVRKEESQKKGERPSKTKLCLVMVEKLII